MEQQAGGGQPKGEGEATLDHDGEHAQPDAPVEQVGLDCLREEEAEHQDDEPHQPPHHPLAPGHQRDAKGAGERGVNNHGDVKPAVDEPEDREHGGGLATRTGAGEGRANRACGTARDAELGDESVAEAAAVPRRGRPDGVEQDDQRKRGPTSRPSVSSDARRLPSISTKRRAVAIDTPARRRTSTRPTPSVARCGKAFSRLIDRAGSETVTPELGEGSAGGGHEGAAWPIRSGSSTPTGGPNRFVHQCTLRLADSSPATT